MFKLPHRKYYDKETFDRGNNTNFHKNPSPRYYVSFVFYRELSGFVARGETLKKPIILDFTATWSGPNKKMDKETYSDELIASVIRV